MARRYTTASAIATTLALTTHMDHGDTEMTVQRAIRKFGTNTTLHGVPRIARSRSVCKKVFWLTVFMGAFTVFGYQLFQLLTKYFSFEKRFNVEIRKDAAEFPLITVCDMRPFDIVTLRDVYRVFSLRDSAKRRAAAEATGNAFITTLLAFYDDISVMMAKLDNDDQSALNELWSPQLLLDLNESMVDAGGSKLGDFVVLCDDSIAKTPCNETQFKMRLLYDGVFLSRCYTYDALQSEAGRTRKKLVSPRHKLDWLAVFMDGHGMLPPMEASRRVLERIDRVFDRALGRSGIEIYIHPRNTQPNLVSQERFVYVPPGHVVNILVNQRQTVLLGQPYGRCRSFYPFDPHPSGPYVQTACYYACLQNAIINKCHCKSSELANADDYPTVPYCFSLGRVMEAAHLHMTSSTSQLKDAVAEVTEGLHCASTTLDENEQLHVTCEQTCPRACEEVTYDLDVRLFLWPKRNTMVHYIIDKIMGELAADNDTSRYELYKEYFHYSLPDDSSAPSQQQQDNDGIASGSFTGRGGGLGTSGQQERFSYGTMVSELTVLNVEMKSLDLAVTSEAPDYSVYQLLSDIGGQLGLWIGMSVITVTEILELIVELIKLLIKRCREAGQEKIGQRRRSMAASAFSQSDVA